ncbi:COG4705 family protein [Herbaspirillum camelliae]|uniref:COG4705 family protein n=1 Tax=Herbaspirillum camelliae TaxID=1892903 RepID=UPI00094A1111|nr:hypothetical protein [Herbaspirillum camelliae]
MFSVTKEEAHSTWSNKVPEATLVFWLIKMMSTTVGETAADFLNADLGFGLGGTSIVVGILFAVALYFQMSSRSYSPIRYWITVLFISVFGTLITDNLTDVLGVPLAWSTVGFSALLLTVFGIWFARERTLSIHHVDSPTRECFYWLAILATFALGTAAGDWFSEGLQLGYGVSAAIFGAAIALVALLHYRFNLSAVVSFWIAYILTRPLGASVGDGLAQEKGNGGLGFGTTGTSVIFMLMIIGLVFMLYRKRR